MQLVQRAGQSRNEQAQARGGAGGLEREPERLGAETDSGAARAGGAWDAARASGDDVRAVTERLKALEAEIAALRLKIDGARGREMRPSGEATNCARAGDAGGAADSLDALIREHSYSTDTVRNIFKANSLGGGLSPVGTLADFLEVDGQYEERGG